MNNKQKKNARKKSSVVIASSVAIGAATAAGVSVGVVLNQNQSTDLHAQVNTTSSADTADSTVVSSATLFNINSANIVFRRNGNDTNIGSFRYELRRQGDQNYDTNFGPIDTEAKRFPAFYTIFDYVKSEYNAVEAMKLAIARGVTITNNPNSSLNGTYTSTDWEVKKYDYSVSGQGNQEMPILVKRPGVTSFPNITAIKFVDNAIYQTTDYDLTRDQVLFTEDQNKNRGFYEVQKFSEFLKQLDLITPSDERESNTKRLLKINNLVHEEIRTYISSSFDLTNVFINKEIVDSKTVFIITGRNKNNDSEVYTITGLPEIYNFEDFRDDLPTLEEVKAQNYDYKKAIYTKIANSSKTRLFNNNFDKNDINEHSNNISILKDGTIVITDNPTNPTKTIYISRGNEGYIFDSLERDYNTSKDDANFPYTFNLVEFENLISTITSKGVGVNNKINLSSVYSNPLFNSYLVKHNYSLSSSTIYYEPDQNTLYVFDETAGSRKAVRFYNLPRVVRSDAVLSENNKALLSFDQLSEKIIEKKEASANLTEDQINEYIKLIFRDHFTSLAISGTVKNYSFIRKPLTFVEFNKQTGSDVEILPADSSYRYFKYEYDETTTSNTPKKVALFVINANEIQALNANKTLINGNSIFNDKNKWETNNANVISAYLKVEDVKLQDLDNYLTTTYNGSQPDFSPSSSRVARISISEDATKGINKSKPNENLDRFVIINTSQPNISSKVIILYGLPDTLTTDEAFVNFNTEATIEQLISAIKNDATNNVDVKQLYLDILKSKLIRSTSGSDNNTIVISGKEYTLDPNYSGTDKKKVKLDFNYENNKKIINLVSADNPSEVVEKIQLKVVENNPSNQFPNPNGLIPNVKRVRWTKSVANSLAFYDLYKKLPQHSSNNNLKVSSASILADEFIQSNIEWNQGGTIEYNFDENFIIIRSEADLNSAVVFYDVPKVTTMQQVIESFVNETNTPNLNRLGGSLIKAIINKYENNQYKLDGDDSLIKTIINESDASNIKLGDYTISRNSSIAQKFDYETKVNNNLDNGTDNSSRRYSKHIYEVTDKSGNAKNKIVIFDNTNFLETKKAFVFYNNDQFTKYKNNKNNDVWEVESIYEEWRNLYKLFEASNDTVLLKDIKTKAPGIYKKLTSSVSEGGYGFYAPENNNDPEAVKKQTSLYLIGNEGQKQIMISGWRFNSSESFNNQNNPVEYSVFAINELPNIVDADNAKVLFTLPDLAKVIENDGNYDKALKQVMGVDANKDNTDQSYKLFKDFNNNADLKLDETNIKWEVNNSLFVPTVASNDTKKSYIRLYKGNSSSSYGSLIIFNNEKIVTSTGTSYANKLDHVKTNEYWQAFRNNSANKADLLRGLLNEQKSSDQKLNDFLPSGFESISTLGVDAQTYYDEGKIIVYENDSNKNEGRMIVIHGVQKVSSLDELFGGQDNVANNVLKEPNKGNLVKAIEERIKLSNLGSLVSNGKVLGISNVDITKEATYNSGTKRITFKDAQNNDIIVNLIEEYNFVIKNERLFTDPNRYKSLFIPSQNGTNTIDLLEDYNNKQAFNRENETRQDVINAYDSVSAIIPRPTHVFKVGTKIVFEGLDTSNKKTFAIFTGSPEIATDFSSGLQNYWLNVFKAIDFTNSKNVFNTNNLDSLLVEAFKEKDKAETNDPSIPSSKLNHTPNDNKVVVDNRAIDISKMNLRVNRHQTNNEEIRYITIAFEGEIELIIEDWKRIAQLSSASFDATLPLNSAANVERAIDLIEAIKAAANTTNLTEGNKKLVDLSGDIETKLNDFKPDSSSEFNRVWYDETKQVIWLINTEKNIGHAITNVPTNITLNINDKTQGDTTFVNSFFVFNRLKDFSLSPSNMLESYVTDSSISDRSISSVSLNDPINFEKVNGSNNLYLVTYGLDAKRLIVKDSTQYFLEKTTGISAETELRDQKKLKELYSNLPINEMVKYSTLTANNELDAVITRLNLTKDNIWLSSQSYQGDNVILMLSYESNASKVYLIHSLPPVAQPSKVRIPTVYGFVKYTGNDEFKFKSAIKDVLDITPSKSNQNVDLSGYSVGWDSANVIVDRSTNKIRVESSTEPTIKLDENKFEIIPEYKTVSLKGADHLKVYELLKKIKALNTQSSIDQSTDNAEKVGVRPQKTLTNDFISDELIESKILEAYANKDLFNNLDKVSVEYFLDTNRTKNDKIIFRIFDDQNRIIHALVIDDVARVIKNAPDAQINVSEEEFIEAIINSSDPAGAIEKKLKTTRANSGNTQAATLLWDLYEYGDSISVAQNRNNFLLTDTNKVYQPVTILNDIEYIPAAASIFDAVTNIKVYNNAIKLLEAEANKTLSLTSLNAPELNAFVNDFGNGMNLADVNVTLKEDKILFKTNQKVLVGINLPKILEVTQETDDKVPSFDTDIVAGVDSANNVVKIYNNFFKETSKFQVDSEGKITISVTGNTKEYKIKASDLVVSFNDDGSIELNSKSEKETIYIVLKPKNEDLNITLVNASVNDANETHDLVKLITSNDQQMDITDEMKQTSFIKDESSIPSDFFNTTSDSIKIKYLKDQNKIVIENITQNKSVIFYNVARVVTAADAYTIDEVVTADKRLQVFIAENVNNSSSTIKEKIQQTKGFEITTGSEGSKVKVTNVGSDNNSSISLPNENSKIQITILDKTVYHLSFEKISAKNQFSSYVAFDNYQKALTDAFVNVDENTIPSELRQAVFNANYGNIAIAGAQVKRIGTSNDNYKLIFKGTNPSTGIEHVVVVHEFPSVYNPTGANDVPAPTIRQLTSVDGLTPEEVYDPVKIMLNTLRKVLANGDASLDDTKVFHTQINAKTARIEVTRPTGEQPNTNANYSYVVSNETNSTSMSLVPNEIVPNVYGEDGTRFNKKAIDLANFEAKYFELKAASTSGQVLWSQIKDTALLSSYIASTSSLKDEVKTLLNDSNKTSDAYVEFDKQNNRILILSETNKYLVIFGNQYKVATNNNAIVVDPLSPDNATNPRLLYKHGEVVAANGNLSSVILDKLNKLQPEDVTVNGYSFKKEFHQPSTSNPGVFVLSDSKTPSANDLYFVDETQYESVDYTARSFTNLVEFYNKTMNHLKTLDEEFSEVTTENVNSQDLTDIINSLNFTTNEAPKMVLGGGKLALIGKDSTTSKTKVYILELPAIQQLDFDIASDDIVNAVGNTTEEKIANLVKQQLKKQAGDKDSVTINGQEIPLNDESVQFTTKDDPATPGNKIVEIVKDGKVLGTIVLNNSIPNVKTFEWSVTKATPLQTWNILWNIIVKNNALEESNPNRKGIVWFNFVNENNPDKTLFSNDLIKNALTANNSEAILTENNKSIEYNKERNEIILRSQNSTIIFANVTKVVSIENSITSSKAYVLSNSDSQTLNSKSSLEALKDYFANLPQDFNNNTKDLSDNLNITYSISANATLSEETDNFKDALTYKFTNKDGSQIFVIDPRQYEISHLDGLAAYGNDVPTFLNLKERMSLDTFKPISEYNDVKLNEFANGLEEPKVIRVQTEDKDVFVLVGKKRVTRNHKNGESETEVEQLVEFVYLISNFPEIPNETVYDLLPSENDILANGGNQAELVKNTLNDPSKFPQSGNPPSINFGGIKLVLEELVTEVQPDGSIKVVDKNGKTVIIPSKNNQTIYKEYDVAPRLQNNPNNDDSEFRFNKLTKTKELLDLLDSTPFTKGEEHALSEAFKNQEPLYYVVQNLVDLGWDLTNATISYDRSKNVILIKDNANPENQSPRIAILKNVPRIIYASDLSNSINDYYIEMARNSNNPIEFIKQKVQTISENNAGASSYFIGKSQPNANNVITGYDGISTPVVTEESYIDSTKAPKTDPAQSANVFEISYRVADDESKSATLFVVDKTIYRNTQQPEFVNFVALNEQIKALGSEQENAFSEVTNEEIKAIATTAFGADSSNNLFISVINSGEKLIILKKDEQNNVVEDLLIVLPKMIDQRKAKLPTKDELFKNSNMSPAELILSYFNDDNKFIKNNNQITIDGVSFDPSQVNIEISADGVIEISKKGVEPKEVIARIIADNPIFPQVKVIDNTSEDIKDQRNPYEIYDLVRLINALPTNVDNFIKLTQEMKAINWLKAKLDAAFANNTTWYDQENTRIKYDIEANKIIIDNNDSNDNKVLVITNVDRVLRTSDRDYKLYDYVDLAEAYNVEKAQEYKADTKTSDEIIKSGIVKALLKLNYEKTINNYEIILKAENTIETADLEFVAHDNTVYKYVDNEPNYKRYVKWTTKDQTYIILDENYVKYSKVDAKQTFRDNIKFKTLFEAIIKANNELELTQEVIDNTPEIQTWIDDIKQDANFDWSQTKIISFASGPNLVLRINKDNMVHINVLSDIPRVVSEKDIGLNIPNDEDVVKSGGDFAQAILNKINDPSQFPRTADGKITINDTEVDPQNIDVRIREDGSIELYDKTNEHLVISINPSSKQPNYTTTKAVLDDAVVAKNLYELIKKTHPLLKSKPRQKALNDQFVNESERLMNNAWIKANIIDVYSVENNPANIKTDFSTWSVEYVANEDKLVFRGKNTDLEKREQVIVVNDVIKVIYASELYVSREVFKNENKETPINKALELTINNALVNKESIGDYDVLNPVLDTNKYTNNHAQQDASQSQDYLQILSNNKPIVVIDNIKYLPSVDGYNVFKDLNALNALITDLDFNKGLEIALFSNSTPPTPLNEEVLTHLNTLGSSGDNVIKTATVGLIDDFLLITAKDDNNRVFVQKITNLPKVVNKNSIEFVSIDDIVNADGDVALAMSKLLKNPEKYKRNDKNNIVFNGKEVNPENLIVELDENNNVVVYEKDANGNKVEPALAIILSNNADANEPTIKFRNVDGQKYWPSYLQEIISNVYKVEENRTITNIKPLSEVLNNKIVQELIKTDFNLSDQATVEYKLEKNQIIIRDNNQQNQNVIIISTKSLQHSEQTPAQLAEYDSKKDYWMIWVAITSIIGGIGLIMLIGLSIYWFNKKPKTTKTKVKK